MHPHLDQDRIVYVRHLAITYLNEKAEPHVRPLAEELESPLILPLDVRIEGRLESVFDAISEKWGELEFQKGRCVYF